MKKVLGLLVLFLLGALFVGCNELPATTTTTTVAVTDTTTVTTTLPATTTTTSAPLTFSSKYVTFINYSEEFTQDEPIDELTFYYYSYKLGIPYVDITEFVTMLLGLIDNTIQIEIIEDTVKVWIEYFYTDEEKLEYGIDKDSDISYVQFNFGNALIEASDVDASDYFTGESETNYSEGLNLVSYTEEEMPLLTIDLTAYDFMLFMLEEGEETKYTIPLSLAGLFLAGANYYVVNNGDYLYGIDIFQIYDVTDSESELYNAVSLNPDLTEDGELESQRFLELCFDNFYGLKDYKEIDSFQEYASHYFSSNTFEYSFTNFLDSFADLHTGVISYGHQNPGYSHTITAPYIYNYYYEYYGCECYLNPRNFYLSFYEDMAYLRITEFTANLKESLEPKMASIVAEAPKYIVIDLSCNGGGFLHGVYYLLNYLTNEDISMYTITDGARTSQTYEVEGDLAIDAEFFFVTSAATYSAANLTVYIAKELGLAKTIGSKSGGGACMVKFLVLPNGAIMQMSSSTNLTSSDYETIEAGVPADYAINFYIAGKNYYQRQIDPDYPSMRDFYTIVTSMSPEE